MPIKEDIGEISRGKKNRNIVKIPTKKKMIVYTLHLRGERHKQRNCSYPPQKKKNHRQEICGDTSKKVNIHTVGAHSNKDTDKTKTYTK